MMDLSRGTSTRLTFQIGMKNSPEWSPDGRQILYAYDRDGPPHLFRKSLGDTCEGVMLLPPAEAAATAGLDAGWSIYHIPGVFEQISN